VCISEQRAQELIVGKKRRIDIVLDNAGFELVTDLCLAELLLAHDLTDVVHFHVKSMPWFVSDVTCDDWDWTLSQLSQGVMGVASDTSLIREPTASDSGPECSPVGSECHLGLRESSFDDPESIGHRFKGHIVDGSWVLKTNSFWTLPYDFSELKSFEPRLYADLSLSDLIIFKGDLNYRKLTGDLKWPVTTSFEEALCGFSPAPLVTLRTLKCDLVVGITTERAETAAAENDDWMLSGSNGVIQYFNPQSDRIV